MSKRNYRATFGGGQFLKLLTKSADKKLNWCKKDFCGGVFSFVYFGNENTPTNWSRLLDNGEHEVKVVKPWLFASCGKRAVAFTLAEVLIALGVVGIVAALIIPGLGNKINTTVSENQQKVFERKLNQATELMQAQGGLSVRYDSAIDFVNELAKYTKIIKICGSDNVQECWGYEEITDSRGEKFKVSAIKRGIALHKSYNFEDTAGIVFADGSNMIITYDKECNILDSDTKYDYGVSSACIAGIYDLNGKSTPNIFGKDIIGFNGASVGCQFIFDGKCFSSVISNYPSVSKSECQKMADSGFGNKKDWCGANTNDYWAGAVKTCGGVDNMVSPEQLTEIARDIYSDKSDEALEKGTTNSADKAKVAKYGFSFNPTMQIWTNKEINKYGAKNRYLRMIYTHPRDVGRQDQYRVLCIIQ